MVTMQAQSDEQLVAAFARGDDAAFDAFYRRYLARITGFHLSRTGRRDLTFDLTAETFAAAIVSVGSFDPDRGSAAGWLFGIAANVLRMSARAEQVEARARLRLGLEPVAVEDVDLERVEELAAAASSGGIEELLADLPAAEREAVLAHVIDEESYEQMSARMACSKAVVRQRVHRGLSRLRKKIKE